MASIILEEYNRLKANADRRRFFESASLNPTNGKRLYKFNTNIKNFGTYCTYIEDVYNETIQIERDKQKNSCLDRGLFKNPINQHTQNYIFRSDIVLKANTFFGSQASPYLRLIVWILLLKEKNDQGKSYIFSNCTDLWRMLPEKIKMEFFTFIRDNQLVGTYNYENEALNSVLFYGDNELLAKYSYCIDKGINMDDFYSTIENEIDGVQQGPIGIRISRMQSSSVKEELKYFYIFYLLNIVVYVKLKTVHF